MTAGSLNKIWSSFVLLQVFLVLTKANDLALRSNNSPALNVSTSLEDYITQNDRQYVAQINGYASEISNFRADYQRQLDTINYNRDFVELTLEETDQKLYPLEMLDELTKHCVQRYTSLLVTTTKVRSAFLSCTNQAITSLNSILSAPENTKQLLTNYYNANWKNGLIDCERKNPVSYANHTICVTDLIAKTNSYFNSNQRTFTTQMEAARCSANSRIRQTIECVYPTMNSALGSVSEVTRLVDDCIAGIKLCQPCNDQVNNTITIRESECPNVINIITNTQTYQNATITNPFYGLNSTMDCLLVNFLKPN